MKYPLSVFPIFVAMAIIGSSSAVGVGGASSSKIVEGGESSSQAGDGTGEKLCTLTNSALINLEDSLKPCMFGPLTGMKDDISLVNSSMEIRKIVRRYCSKLPQGRPCTANLTSNARNCMNETDFTEFTLLRDFYQTALDVACSQDGERFAVLIEEVRRVYRNNTQRRTILDECDIFAEVEFARLESKDQLLHPGMYQYKAVKSLKECVVEQRQGQSSLVNVGESLLNDLLDKMTCTNSQLGTAVLCGTLDNTNLREHKGK